jgi:hypothetical protein
MRKAMFIVFGLLIFFFFLYAQNTPEVTISNKTGYTVHYIYIISSSSDDSWGENMLASALRDGYQTTIALPVNEGTRYNIQIVDSEGDSYTKRNVQVTANSRIEFTYRDVDNG